MCFYFIIISFQIYDVHLTPSHGDNKTNNKSREGNNIFQLLGLQGKEERCCMVYVKGSQRLDGNALDPNAEHQPCGILSPARSPGAQAELLILPTNFHIFINILK